MKKIVLIHPKSPETFWQLTGLLDIIKKKAVIPPLGLATVAALTPSEYEVQIVDEEIESIDFDMSCDIVGITGYTLHARRMYEISQEFRKRGKLTVGGGPFCTVHRDECKDYFDVLICGEAEFIWPKFLKDYEKGNHTDVYIEHDKIDMTTSPIPKWEIVNTDAYSGFMVQTSRGCPYDCEFCDVVSLFGRKMRYKDYDQIITEIKKLVNLGKAEIFLADDNFIGNKRFVKELLTRLIEFNKTLSRPIRYMTQVTLNVAEDESLLDLFQEANFFSFFIGIETPKEESLIHTNKEHNIRFDMVEAVRRIQSRGIFIISGMIVGFDTDDLDIFRLQSQFLMDAGLTIPMLGMLIAPKGTKLWDRMEKEGRLYPNLEIGDMFDLTNIEPKLMSKKDLEINYLKLLNEVFDISHFKKRFEKLIDQVDLSKVKKNSALSRQMNPLNSRPYFLGVTYRVLKYFIFQGSQEEKDLFKFALKKVFKKGMICFPWLIEILLYFKAVNSFVESHQFNDVMLLSQEKKAKTTPAELYQIK